MSIQDDIDRGIKAAKLIEDPLLKEAFNSVRSAITEAWAEAPIRDKDGHHELKLMLKLLADVEGYFNRAIVDGTFAAEELKRQNMAAKIIKRVRGR